MLFCLVVLQVRTVPAAAPEVVPAAPPEVVPAEAVLASESEEKEEIGQIL